MKRKLFIVCLFYNLLLGGGVITTAWGPCTIQHNNAIINYNLLEKIIINKVDKLNRLYAPITVSPFEIIIFTPEIESELKINNKHWDWSLGITYNQKDKIIIKDITYKNMHLNKFKQVVEHELNHLMMNRASLYNNVPRWYKEGFAMYIAKEITLNHKLIVIKNLFRNHLFSLEQLYTFKNFNRDEFNLAYAQSALFVESIQHIYGEQIFLTIINELKLNNNFNNAIYNATSHKLLQIENNIIEYIYAKYRWLKFITFSDLLFSLMPLLLVIGFIIKSYKTKKIKEQWDLEEQIEDLS